MRTIEWTTQFKRDYRKAFANPRHRDLPSLPEQVATELANDKSLADKHRDHALTGDSTKHRECHLKPDLLLLYKKPDAST